MKKLFIFSLLFLGVLSYIFCQGKEQSASDFEYKIENNSITIIGYKGTAKDVVIPEEIGKLPVKTIGKRAFAYNQLTSVVIPNFVEAIEQSAFFDNRLTSIVSPNSVETIEENAFFKNRLTSIIIGHSVKTIEKHAFRSNRLTSVVIPRSIKFIARLAFDDDVKITMK